MDESREIILNSLHRCGVSVPSSCSSIRDITPSTLVSICAQALNLIDDDRTEPFSISLPNSVADQIKICTSIAAAVKNLGYIGNLSFQKILYPSEEDLYKLIRFFVERLSKASENRRNAALNDVIKNQKASNQFSNLSLTNEVTKFSDNSIAALCVSRDNMDEVDVDNATCSATQNFLEVQSIDEPEERDKLSSDNPKCDVRDYKILELQHLDKEFPLLKDVEHMACNDIHSIEFYVKQLEEQLDSKKLNLLELKLKWVTEREILEKKKSGLEELLYTDNPEVREKYRELGEIEQENNFIMSEIRKRDEELSKLSADLEGQPKPASRKSYIDRVKEITKNSRKQDIDIEQILTRTRELQLESNSIRESLHRTHAVVDELIFREARKDPLGKQAYRLLTGIHENFEQISEKILATDRLRREAAEHEKKLAGLATRRLNIEKLEADLNSIRRENNMLELNSSSLL